MAPHQSRKSAPVEFHHERESESEDKDQESTQGSALDGSALDMVKVAQDLIITHKRRREKKRKAIEAAHQEDVKVLRAKIDEHYESRKLRITKLQRAQLDRLEDIYKRRRALERLIFESMKSIKSHHVNMARELKATFKGREGDILVASEKV